MYMYVFFFLFIFVATTALFWLSSALNRREESQQASTSPAYLFSYTNPHLNKTHSHIYIYR